MPRGIFAWPYCSGDPVNDGTQLLKDSAEACCAACADMPEPDRCNAWVYCGYGRGPRYHLTVCS